MEVSLFKVPNENSTKPVAVSKSIHPHIVPRAVEVVVANNEQGTEKCEHFTIRGYVAGVRKREAKACSPLLMLYNNTSNEHANSLPPLCVKKFRWWRCQSCLHKDIAPETAVANAEIMKIKSDEVKNDNHHFLASNTVTSHPGMRKPCCFSRASEEKVLGGKLNGKDISTYLTKGGCHSSLCVGKKQIEYLNAELRKEGIEFKLSKCDLSTSEEYHNHSEPIHVATKEGSSQEGGKGANIMVSANSSGTLLGENTPNIVPSKSVKTERVRRIDGPEQASDKMVTSTSKVLAASCNRKGVVQIRKKELCTNVAKKNGMPPGEAACIPKDSTLSAVLSSVSHCDSECLGKGFHEASDFIMHLTDKMVESHNDARTPVSFEKMLHRKARKVRSLDDIMRSEEFRTTVKATISIGDAGASGNNNDKCPDASKEKDSHPDRRLHFSTQNIDAKPTKRKKRTKVVSNYGEGPSLVHWLKKTPKEISTRNVVAESKNIETEICNFKGASMQDLDLNLQYCGEGVDKQDGIVENQNMMHQVEVMTPSLRHQQDSMIWKGDMITEDLPTRNSIPKSINSKSKLNVISDRSLHHGTKNQFCTHKKSILGNRKNKRPRVEHDEFSQKKLLKDSIGKGRKSCFQKRTTSTSTSEQEALDDIPMDIVELLARSQHEKLLLNAKDDAGRVHSFPEVAENRRAANVTGCHGSKVSDAVHMSTQPKITVYSAWTSFEGNRDSNGRPKAQLSINNRKENHHTDLGQQEFIDASTGIQAFSQYCGLSVNGKQLSVIDPSRTCSPESFHCNGMKMQPLGLQNMDHIVPASRNSNNGLVVLSNKNASGINYWKVDADSNSSSMHLVGNHSAVTSNAGYETFIGPSDEHLLNSKYKAESSTDEGNFTAKYFPDSVHGYHSKMMGPRDLYTNETISALNLLRLMDPACSIKPCHSSVHNDHIGYIQEANGQGGELLGSQIGLRIREAPQISSTVGNIGGDQQSGNPCMVVRPLPRVGVLGPSLQKEMETDIKSRTAPFAFQSQNANTTTFLMTNGNEKTKVSHSANLPNITQTSLSRDQNFKWIRSSVGSFGNPECSVARDNSNQIVTGGKYGAVQPQRNTNKMEECIVNRNPADFAMVDEDSEFMIGYEEPNTRYNPPRSLHFPIHSYGQKRKKVTKFNDLKWFMRP